MKFFALLALTFAFPLSVSAPALAGEPLPLRLQPLQFVSAVTGELFAAEPTLVTGAEPVHSLAAGSVAGSAMQYEHVCQFGFVYAALMPGQSARYQTGLGRGVAELRDPQTGEHMRCDDYYDRVEAGDLNDMR